jgi:hypothetical protein
VIFIMDIEAEVQVGLALLAPNIGIFAVDLLLESGPKAVLMAEVVTLAE